MTTATHRRSRPALGLATALDPRTTDSDHLLNLGKALAALSNKIEPPVAAQVAKDLAVALENQQIVDSEALWSIGESLAKCCRSLPSARETRLLALSNLLLRPVLPEKAELNAPVPENGDLQGEFGDRHLLEQTCAQLSIPDLAEVLKYPFCTGQAQQIFLKRLNDATGKKFGPDVWTFVEEASSLGIQGIEKPARRPSGQTAVEELAGLQPKP